ncbi:MAG: hypothetical protein RMY36_018285 [Nostoc sp. SerVER01]|nr:hypothetical protein [Nostoc sp. SerVER01]MDZ8078174.1 hypothetical protein [Nostoc sp. DcaGUA01]
MAQSFSLSLPAIADFDKLMIIDFSRMVKIYPLGTLREQGVRRPAFNSKVFCSNATTVGHTVSQPFGFAQALKLEQRTTSGLGNAFELRISSPLGRRVSIKSLNVKASALIISLQPNIK